MQNHYNLLYREEEREMIGLCLAEGIGVIPWSPLARGRLTRPWQAETTKRSETDRFGNAMYARTEEADRKVVDRLGEIAEKRGVPRAQVALAWLLSKPGSHRADRRRHEAASSRGRSRGAFATSVTGRNHGARRALHAASGARVQLMQNGAERPLTTDN